MTRVHFDTTTAAPISRRAVEWQEACGADGVARILVIDDDARVRRFIVNVLTAAEHETLEARDGLEGLSQFLIHRPNLVILDLFMPVADGIETIRALRDAAPWLQILAISGGGASQEMVFLDLAKKLGADAALAKPFAAAALLKAVGRVLA